MAKLYPPYVEGTIPACSGTVLTVPFSMNKAVGKNEVYGIILKLKTVQNSLFLDNIPHLTYSIDPKCEASFDISNQSLIVGQYYKVQLAYVDKLGNTGHFSTVGVFKYTADPKLEIENMDLAKVNKHKGNYVGVYNQEGLDPTEKVYTYQFKLYNSKNELIEDSGELLHNSAKDDEVYESYDEYSFYSDLDENLSYYIMYAVTTLNGYHKCTPKYRVMQAKSIQPEILATLNASLNFENGYINLELVGKKDEDTELEYLSAGSFVITRKSSLPDATWEEVLRFSLQAEVPSRHLLKDCTVQQGVSYIYSLQQYNDNGLYSERILSDWIYVDFEDSFLYDGKRQLKIRYNPKVSSFKNTILESKMDTIGSKHPFIFRNGNVNYKEFPISGLISYYMDEENLFMSEEEFKVEEKTTNLIGENIAAEREFKLAVLEWLTNGEPKLFRSPNEGNYIVRLMNTSLSPTDTVGRMLHTFSCTAYEIDDFNYENLGKYNILQIQELDTTRLRWATIEFRNIEADSADSTKSVVLNEYPVESVSFVDLLPGDKVFLDGKEFYIGVTGGYSFNVSNPIQEVRINMGNSRQGSMTYSFYSKATTLYELVHDVTVIDVPARQFIGKTLNIVDKIENIRDNILEFFSLQFKKRPIYYAYYKDNNDKILYEDSLCTVLLTAETADVFALYDVRNATDTINGQKPDPEKLNSEYYIDRQFDLFYPRPKNAYYYDGQNFGKQIGRIPIEQYSCVFKLNDNEIDLSITEAFSTSNLKNVKNIELSCGVWLECAYQLQQVDYHLQFDSAYESKIRYDEYLSWITAYQELVKSVDSWEDEQINSLKDTFYNNRLSYATNAELAYDLFIEVLEQEIKQYKENNGIVW